MENQLKTGTTTLGIVCKDGIVLAADKRATAGNFIANRDVDKIQEVTNKMALTTAGTVSDVQLLTKLVRAEIQLKALGSNREITVKEAANLLAGMVYMNIRKMSMIPGISHFLFAGTDQFGFGLYDIYADGSLSECKDFVSSGSGSVMAYGVLETLYKKDMSIEEGTQLALKAISAAMARDSASGNGVDVMTITKEGAKRTMTKMVNDRILI